MNNVELGTKIFLNPKNRTEIDAEFELASFLYAVMDDGHIVLNAPIYNGVLYPFSVGETLVISFSNENGHCDLWCAVAELFQKREFHYIKVQLLSDIEYIDHRDSFRVKTSITGTAYVSSQQGNETHTRKLNYMCTNISESGATIYLDDGNLAVGDYITVSLPIRPDGQAEDIVSEIRWIAPFDTSCRKNFDIYMGVRFHFSKKSQRSAIVKYVLLCQQKIMKNRRMLGQ